MSLIIFVEHDEKHFNLGSICGFWSKVKILERHDTFLLTVLVIPFSQIVEIGVLALSEYLTDLFFKARELDSFSGYIQISGIKVTIYQLDCASLIVMDQVV